MRIRLALNRWLSRFLIIFFITYALLAWRFYTRTPAIARNFAAEYNAPILAIPETDLAWPLYRMSAARFEPTSNMGDLFWNRWPNMRPGEPLWDQVGPCLDRNREALEMLRLATKRPALGFIISDAPPASVDPAASSLPPSAPGSPNPFYMDWNLSYLGSLRQAARWLKLDAVHAAHSQDRVRLVDDLIGLFGVASHAREHSIVIGDLVSVAVFYLACDTLGEVVADYPEVLSDADLTALDSEVLSYAGGSISLRVDGDRVFVEDVLQRAYSDDGTGEGHLTAQGLRNIKEMQGDPSPLTPGELAFAPLAIANRATRKELSAQHENLLTLLQTDFSVPAWQRGELLLDAEVDRINADSQLASRYRIVMVLPPALLKAALVMEQAIQIRDATHTVIALTRYRLRHGDYPASLPNLVPEFLPDVPADLFDGGPVKYASDESGSRLYSVGADGDDDGGTSPAPPHKMEARIWRPPSHSGLAPDGDWLLWPIRPDPPPPEPPADEQDGDE